MQAPDWNPDPRLYQRAETIHGLFADCVRSRGEATALIAGERRLSYRELDELSDAYAIALTEFGVMPGHQVPVIMNRGAELVAILLAVLKAGAAYAALDPRWPSQRLDELVRQLDTPIVVSTVDGPWNPVRWQPPSPARILALTSAEAAPEVTVCGEDPCSVFFTSGSSGTPKGVLSPHSGTVRLFDEGGFVDYGPGAIVPQIAPASWDGFVLDCWGPLLTGGTLVLIDAPVLEPAILRAAIREHGVNTAFLTTSLFHVLVDADLDSFSGMHTVIVGGERLSAPHARRFLARHKEIALHNIYGPVECTALVTTHRVSLADCDRDVGIPLGSVVDNTEVFLFDGDRVCGADEVGEIVLAGDGIALGYLGDEELTARRFESIWLDGAQRTCYRTGDFGHWSRELGLCFDGRRDAQIKIRGHRIEPGEVENLIGAVPGVSSCVAIALPTEDGAYHDLVLCYLGTVSVGELGTELLHRLPAHLQPRLRIQLERFPLLANGKVDRITLRGIAARHRGAEKANPAPAGSDLPGRISALVTELFGVELTGSGDSLFAAGLNSLDIARLCARLDTEFGIAVPASQVYRHPSVDELSTWLGAAVAEPVSTGEPVDAGTFELPPQQAAFLWADAYDDSHLAGLCRLAWWIDGEIDRPALRLALGDLHRRHETLHVRYELREVPVAVVGEYRAEPEYYELTEFTDDPSVVDGVLGTLFRPIAVEDAVVWRIALARSRSSGRSLLGIVVHHVAFDGAAESVLAEELGIAYRARVAGEAPRFDRPATTMARLSAAHQRKSQLVNMAEQRDYWHGQLDELPELVIPGRSWSAASAGPKASAMATIDAATVARWDAIASSSSTTRFGYLAAAYGTAIRQATGCADFAVKVPVVNRGQSGTHSVISCQVDWLCLRFWREGGEGIDAAVRAVDAAFAAQDVPFTEISAMLLGAGNGAALLGMPSLIYQDDAEPVLDLPGCRAELFRPEGPNMSTELELDLRPRPDGTLLATCTVRTDVVPLEFAENLLATLISVLRPVAAEVGGLACVS